MRTTLAIEGLQLYSYHGLIDEERRLGQKFLFDIRCELADVATHLDDRLAQSVGYHVLADDVASVSASQAFKTLEALAETIARALLARHAAISSVTLRIAKLSPPMAHALQAACVEIALDRAELVAQAAPSTHSG